MSVKRFKFVSPGVFINEIDNSQLPRTQNKLGPVIIGRTLRGPAMRPVTVESQSEFVEMFGQPQPGGVANDVWREGNLQSPMYATYAAMSYLRNNGPVTMVRLLGNNHEDATGAGEAGWSVAKEAYGLFLWDSGAAHNPATPVTGTLAAVFYSKLGAPVLKGPARSGSADNMTHVSGTGGAIKSVGDDREFMMTIWNTAAGSTAAVSKDITTSFNFNKRSSKFIRKVFNTNPALLDATSIAAENRKDYFLGQTFENTLVDYLGNSDAGSVLGIVAPLREKSGGSNRAGNDFRMAATAGTTGWIFSQDLTADSGSFAPALSDAGAVTGGVDKLFKIHALNSGEWESKNLKVSIRDIKYARNPEENPYGTFTVEVRRVQDSDISRQVVESFSNCNLNPSSPNYIKRKIGDQSLSWNETERRYTYQGDYENNSRFIRIESSEDLDAAALDPQCLPFGFFGPPKLSSVNLAGNNDVTCPANVLFNVTTSDVDSLAPAGNKFKAYDEIELQLDFPECPIRKNSASGSLSNRKQAYWGAYTQEPSNDKTTNASWGDHMYPLPDSLGTDSDLVEASCWAFSLDDIKLSGSNNADALWAAGNRKANDSISVTSSWSGTLDQGCDKFTMPLWGGFDGHNINVLDPYAPDVVMASDSTDKTDSSFYSIKKAIDACSSQEEVEFNLMAMPGITHRVLNRHMVDVCESRGDALAVLDIAGGYKPRANRSAGDAFSSYGGTVDATLDEIDELQINSSYACTYYPWVQIKDSATDAVLWSPPSVVALGTFASSERKSDVWFAPAGFTRGGLTEGSAGMPVLGVRDRLTAKDRDDLYAARVNPIASFPAEGIVIFGQKTMQVTASALDRINVRRLMIYVKKEISRMAATTLFEPNVQRTWFNFTSRVEPFLQGVKAGLGLEDFKVVLDETTTTPDLVDRNIMYAKILLKPTKAIEYIAIDFVITNSGASFED